MPRQESDKDDLPGDKDAVRAGLKEELGSQRNAA